MSEANSEQDRLLDEAIDLLIRQRNDPGNHVSMDMIRAWRARSLLHDEAWSRVARIHGASGKILNEKRRMERQKELGSTRRKFMIGGFAAVGAGAVGYAFGPNMLLQAKADYITNKGEIRHIDLPDGSRATLGPSSAIRLDFRSDQRMVDLLAGMSFFEVRATKSQPFSVRSSSFHVATMSAAEFDISEDTDILSVSVDHGAIDIGVEEGRSMPPIGVSGGEWVTIDPSDGSIDRGQRENGQIASWRDNLLIAERDTVSVLVTRIGRWLPGRIVVADPYIGRQRISGIYDLNDPLRALRAVVRPTGAHVRQISPYVTVITPV